MPAAPRAAPAKGERARHGATPDLSPHACGILPDPLPASRHSVGPRRHSRFGNRLGYRPLQAIVLHRPRVSAARSAGINTGRATDGLTPAGPAVRAKHAPATESRPMGQRLSWLEDHVRGQELPARGLYHPTDGLRPNQLSGIRASRAGNFYARNQATFFQSVFAARHGEEAIRRVPGATAGSSSSGVLQGE